MSTTVVLVVVGRGGGGGGGHTTGGWGGGGTAAMPNCQCFLRKLHGCFFSESLLECTRVLLDAGTLREKIRRTCYARRLVGALHPSPPGPPTLLPPFSSAPAFSPLFRAGSETSPIAAPYHETAACGPLCRLARPGRAPPRRPSRRAPRRHHVGGPRGHPRRTRRRCRPCHPHRYDGWRLRLCRRRTIGGLSAGWHRPNGCWWQLLRRRRPWCRCPPGPLPRSSCCCRHRRSRCQAAGGDDPCPPRCPRSARWWCSGGHC